MDTLNNRKQLELKIIEACQDKEFEKLLLSNSSAALQKLNIRLPRQTHFKVIQEKKDELILVLPALLSESELNESELLAASGGSTAMSATADGNMGASRPGFP